MASTMNSSDVTSEFFGLGGVKVVVTAFSWADGIWHWLLPHNFSQLGVSTPELKYPAPLGGATVWCKSHYFVEVIAATTSIFQGECDSCELLVQIFEYIDDFMILGITHADVMGTFAVLDKLGG